MRPVKIQKHQTIVETVTLKVICNMLAQRPSNATIATQKVIEHQNVKNLKDQESVQTVGKWVTKQFSAPVLKSASIAKEKVIHKMIVLILQSHAQTVNQKNTDSRIARSPRNLWCATTAGSLVTAIGVVLNHGIAETAESQAMKPMIVKMITWIHHAVSVDKMAMK